jgi:hypothetical protein
VLDHDSSMSRPLSHWADGSRRVMSGRRTGSVSQRCRM